jgi:hypothetical protein
MARREPRPNPGPPPKSTRSAPNVALSITRGDTAQATPNWWVEVCANRRLHRVRATDLRAVADGDGDEELNRPAEDADGQAQVAQLHQRTFGTDVLQCPGHAMTYDAARQRIVLFGGGSLNDTGNTTAPSGSRSSVPARQRGTRPC